jgi:UDPglucose 6-dehydrogenase
MRTIKPCVVGLGKLGLPLAAVIADAGFETVGIDSNTHLIEEINSMRFTSPEPNLNETLQRNSSKLKFGNEFRVADACDIYFLIVPTPSMADGKFDNSYLLNAISSLLKCWIDLTGEKTIVIVSTVMPGTCLNVFIPLIRNWENETANKLKINLLYSPEFIALGSVIYNLVNPDMTLIGCENEDQAGIFLEIMGRVNKGSSEIKILNLSEAEIVKILVNCFVTMKISFANFIGEISDVIENTNKHRIAEALGLDSRIGGKYLRPGLGFAGPCFPRDNTALIALSKQFGLEASLALATDDINNRQPINVVRRFKHLFPKANKIGIAGITYKPHTKVIDESQTLKIARLLQESNLDTLLFDPLLSSEDVKGFQITQRISDLYVCDVILVSEEFVHLVDKDRELSSKLLVI